MYFLANFTFEYYTLQKIFLVLAALAFFIVSCKKKFQEPVPPEPDPPVNDTANLKNYNKDITIVNWNIEWFGSSTFNGNLDVQETNAGKILKYLNADLYGICEVVDTARFGRMIRNVLGDEYRYVISPYPTVAQKMAVVYNRHIFRKVKTRVFLGLSSSARVSFAYGRFPFQMDADVVVNGARHPVSVYLLHAKAGSDQNSYNSRFNGSNEMKDSLDLLAGKKFIIIGDFNDHLNGSITYGKPSPYKNFIDDQARYFGVTYALNVPGYKSTINYENSVIDQQVASSPFAIWYVSSSAKIRTDVKTVVSDFDKRNTSDHYPVSSQYRVTH